MTSGSTQPMITLNDGTHIPQLGFGTFKIDPAETQQVVETALEVGYRHIDTAMIYQNEAEVGAAVRASGIPRDEIYVTTKLWNDDQGADTALAAFDASMERLGLDYVDLYLVHWPCPAKDRYIESWKVLEEIRASGRAKSIGVSNFLVPHLTRLLAETDVKPVLNQIELHPAHQQPAVAEFCREAGIAVEAWGPLGQGKYPLFELPPVADAAEATGKTPAQVVLRWHLQRGNIVFPKSVDPARIAENFDVFNFTLSDEQMDAITALEREGRVSADPNEVN